MPMAYIYKMGPCGGAGGEPRDTNILGITRIVKVHIRHCDTVDGICTFFERNGHVESTDLWGGNGGKLTEILLKEDEYIVSVSGYIGYFKNLFLVRSLTIVTNQGVYGPYGQEQGIPFGLPAVSGKIIGFHGRSGTYLDSIGVYVEIESTEDKKKQPILKMGGTAQDSSEEWIFYATSTSKELMEQ